MTWSVANHIEKEHTSNQCEFFDPLFNYFVLMVFANAAIGSALIAFSDCILKPITSKTTIVSSVCSDGDATVSCMSFERGLSK